MKMIPLTKGYEAIVDDEDFDALIRWKWQVYFSNSNTAYGRRGVYENGVRVGHQQMHRAILGVTADLQVDHINRNGLDNRRANLRPATASQNGANRVFYRPRSGFRGVYARGATRWAAGIRHKQQMIHLGFHGSPVDAARAFDAAAKKLHGEFAVLNFPEAL